MDLIDVAEQDAYKFIQDSVRPGLSDLDVLDLVKIAHMRGFTAGCKETLSRLHRNELNLKDKIVGGLNE